MTINILMYISSNISESLVIVYIILLFSVILLKLLKVFPYESVFLFGECEVFNFIAVPILTSHVLMDIRVVGLSPLEVALWLSVVPIPLYT